MLLSALRSSCRFIFVRLLEGDQLNVCVCVRVRACVLFITSVSWPLGFDSTWSAAVCDLVPRLDTTWSAAVCDLVPRLDTTWNAAVCDLVPRLDTTWSAAVCDLVPRLDTTWSAAVCDLVPRLDPAVFIFKTPDDFAKAYVDVSSLTVVRKVRPLLRPFARKSQLFSAITCRSLAPNFTQIGPKMWAARKQISLRP